MSTRLQVLLKEDELEAIKAASQSSNQTVADWVRDSIQAKLKTDAIPSQAEKMAHILKFSKFNGPTADIKQLLHEIDQGKDG